MDKRDQSRTNYSNGNHSFLNGPTVCQAACGLPGKWSLVELQNHQAHELEAELGADKKHGGDNKAYNPRKCEELPEGP